ncbi:MAG: ClpXP protease specificity-enhancing factor [Gammaproteobacteria bacterium]|nr:ClpXP protease specificity-enhancing factor [Gammaproteobacteria bacterium]NIR82279.1 ClpXP protease specificity-enhancing factor [Gammaproteobacteria bacterium]NIR91210.1 ClpXP protease specificity-enhancing factor [Gammaproteobacteria bacterium]NIU03428.1 ClpXP protease specificity-enhancing factor [Gammaproteobacteria bacterium]NIX84703.1 ClpXP protease specificity-enhancing factor [Gammaproteobacteria bacterium]
MTPSRPYLVRAVHDWIVDNDLTPQLVVNAETNGVQVPPGFVQDGKIVLNISSKAVRNLQIGNEWIGFAARFGGAPYDVVVPTSAVLAVYARETGVGMAFQEKTTDGQPPPEPPEGKPSRPSLRVVK